MSELCTSQEHLPGGRGDPPLRITRHIDGVSGDLLPKQTIFSFQSKSRATLAFYSLTLIGFRAADQVYGSVFAERPHHERFVSLVIGERVRLLCLSASSDE